jgi:hypothetical protein
VHKTPPHFNVFLAGEHRILVTNKGRQGFSDHKKVSKSNAFSSASISKLRTAGKNK